METNEDSRYPYTYAADYVRSLAGYGEDGSTKLNRSDLSVGRETRMNTGDRVRILEGASDWMKKHGRWMDFLPDSIDGAQGIVVADYTHFSGNNCHYIIEIDNGIGMVGIYPMWLIPVDARAGQNQSDPATRMHACLICQHSQMFGQPERLLANDTISFGFECVGPPLQGAYGLEHEPHTMIFWPETMTVNVDGGQSIPNGGCEGYIYRPAAVACDAVCQQPKRAEKTSRGSGENVNQEQLILELNKALLEALKAFDRMYVSDIPHDHRDFKVVMKARAVIERVNNILGTGVL